MIASLVLAVSAPLSGMPLAAPALAPAAVRSALETKAVSIETSDRQKLQATFFLPKNTDQLAPGVLLVHDAGSERSQLEGLAEKLQKMGFAVLSVDLRTHGESKSGAKKWDAMSEEEQSTTWAFAARDVDASSRWLSKQDTVHATNISIVGVRAGSSLAVRHAARDQNIMSVVLVAPATEQFGFDLEDEIGDLEGLPTCILARRSEAAVADALCERGNSSGDPFIEVIKTSSKTDELDRKTMTEIAKWLKEHAMPKKGR